jgi:hypothetical protein
VREDRELKKNQKQIKREKKRISKKERTNVVTRISISGMKGDK